MAQQSPEIDPSPEINPLVNQQETELPERSTTPAAGDYDEDFDDIFEESGDEVAGEDGDDVKHEERGQARC